MIEFENMSYIFGSFARRRQSQNIDSIKRKSSGQVKIVHDRSKSTPNSMKKVANTSPRAKSVCVSSNESKFKCSICGKYFVEPKILPCFHTFCLKCLEELGEGQKQFWNETDDKKTGSPDSRKTSSGGSGYGSDKQEEISNKTLTCPTCGERADIPPRGVSAFPPNFPLQHRMVLRTLNAHTTHLLCDLCTSDVTATSRCMDCAISFCSTCEQLHLRQKLSAEHEVLPLEEARNKGITKIRRQILCTMHNKNELSLFCSTCSQVICRECVPSHKNHICEQIHRAAKTHISNLKGALEKTQVLIDQSVQSAARLNATSKEISVRCNKVQTDVEKFFEEYMKAIKEHKSNLLDQIMRVREEKLNAINKQMDVLQKKIRDSRDVSYFLEDLLNDGTEVEILSFLKMTMDKLESYNNRECGEDMKISGSIQFFPEDPVECNDTPYTLYGVISTQSISPHHCILQSEGIHNLRVGKRVEAILETKDSHGIPLDRGGENVFADAFYRNAGILRYINTSVKDNKDGTYTIYFTPDVAGKLFLNVRIRDQQIKDNPIPLIIRSLKPHQGIYHCCTFCSSGGSKVAICGCGGKMPGGYKGCGHGHNGHPGKRHWSCCGNVLEHSECNRTSSQYQITI